MNSNVRQRIGLGLAATLGVLFVAIGLLLALAGNRPSADLVHAPWQHMFGVRDAFLGAFVLVLIIARERRALFLFMCSAMLLPIIDTLATAQDLGLAWAGAANLPYVLPLALVVCLLWPWRKNAAA